MVWCAQGSHTEHAAGGAHVYKGQGGGGAGGGRTGARWGGGGAVGGRAAGVEMEMCDIGTVVMKLMQIKGNDDCRAGCPGGAGACGDEWYPGGEDSCSSACGIVFEPFWDQCGEMLVSAGMGGMGEMSLFCAPPRTHHCAREEAS